MALSCIISDIGRKSLFSYHVCIRRPCPRRNIAIRLDTRMMWLPGGEKNTKMFTCFDTMHERDGRQTGRHRATAKAAPARQNVLK